jgi:hypothetical protein
MSIFFFIAGAALLVFGRKLFWLFAAAIGFLLGMSFAQQLLPGQSQTVQLIIALVIGGLGAVLAIMVQKIAIGLVGFIAGAYLVNLLIPTFSIALGSFLWVAVIVGGIIGALLATTMFDWALIFLSSAIGASVIVNHLILPQSFHLVILAALLLLGLVIQAKIKGTE